MSHIEESVNELGTPVSVFKCDACGDTLTVCPAVPEEKRGEWTGCLAEECPSYEPTRDADLYLGLGMLHLGGRE